MSIRHKEEKDRKCFLRSFFFFGFLKLGPVQTGRPPVIGDGRSSRSLCLSTAQPEIQEMGPANSADWVPQLTTGSLLIAGAANSGQFLLGRYLEWRRDFRLPPWVLWRGAVHSANAFGRLLRMFWSSCAGPSFSCMHRARTCLVDEMKAMSRQRVPLRRRRIHCALSRPSAQSGLIRSCRILRIIAGRSNTGAV